jgi:DNA-binding NarL/FixJ family response regulator
MSTRVVIADDHPIVIGGLAAIIAAERDMELVGVAATTSDVAPLCRAADPDVVVMDLSLPGGGGLEATRALLADRPTVGVLVLTLHDDDDSLYGALRAGARGYVLKGATHDELAWALRGVAAGQAIFDAAVAHRILAHFGPTPVRPPDPFPDLTAREREVLALLAAGLGTKEIALKLFLSPKTVRNNVAGILAKLGVPDRAQAIAHARAAGLPAGGHH